MDEKIDLEVMNLLRRIVRELDVYVVVKDDGDDDLSYFVYDSELMKNGAEVFLYPLSEMFFVVSDRCIKNPKGIKSVIECDCWNALFSDCCVS